MVRPLEHPEVEGTAWLSPFVSDFKGRFTSLLGGAFRWEGGRGSSAARGVEGGGWAEKGMPEPDEQEAQEKFPTPALDSLMP